ncbi:WNT1-inducible-signaling pathway protein 2 isoform X2 [Periophthalmus magnuspinnatus]|uniref:WNT1-inducible-signaling pathway protein 2 isoform X2 n=1 Tax=Periophthalmus magnuspinnatus TaxID=409849 RepID=UPI0024370F25|nr:WNT1-inducible-signaling pathway protein 2 isoform X2 [Periophthalmus magnuspinnatus]
MMNRDWLQSAVLLLCITAQVLCQLCQTPCRCPKNIPKCRAGVPLVLDGCGCCQVCARERGEPCTELNPCDKGLQCDHSTSLPGEPGECVGLEEMGCELNGVSYAEGQAFRPSCDSSCLCTGGGVTCVHTCPLSTHLPAPDCPSPQYIRLPGKCCPEWVCESLENTVIQDAITAQGSGGLWPSLPRTPPRNRLGPPAPPPRLPLPPHKPPHQPPVPPHKPPHRPSLPPRCVEQSTQWSACSRSCGSGVSTRVSNQNPSCRLQLETRLCKVRPCSALYQPKLRPPGPGRGDRGVCQPTVLPPGRIRLFHEGCFSTRTFNLRYCGLCSDTRCCTPHHTSTAQVALMCPGGRLQHRAVMFIHSCVCHHHCPYAPHKNPALWGYRP